MHKRPLTNAKRISDYNKFLATLDQTNTKSTIVHPVEDKKYIKSEEEMKNFIDKIIKNLEIDFEKNNLDSSKLTGQTPNDIIEANLKINDPNEYVEFENIQSKSCSTGETCCQPEPVKRVIKKIIKKKEPVVEIKEYINIDIEINDIDDILKLIETYKADPSIKYNINIKALHNIKDPLEDLKNMIGMNDLKNNIVDQILYFVQDLHKDNKSQGDFMHSVIYGPPGTGKTEIAKIMGRIYCKLGCLSKGVFHKVTRSDLIAGYLGQTALKTKDAIKAAMGGVLFIDEAYSLGNSEKRDSFAKECIDTLCEALSDNKSDLMVIIAGYEHELKECFFDYNQGLDSRFTWRFKTDEYNFEDLYQIFFKKVKEIGWIIDDNSCITSEWFKKNKDYFKFYGRDIETILAKTKIAHSKRVFCKPENEKKRLNLNDLENGFKIYLKNENVKNRKSELENKKYLYNTLYS
jgi:SpoVK/Ycf46/Vps4 family AAA+-type ATPase